MSGQESERALIRKRLLGRQLRAQRQLIIEQIKPSTAEFPRSATMCLLLRRPELSLRLALGVVAALRRGWRLVPSPKTSPAAVEKMPTGAGPHSMLPGP